MAAQAKKRPIYVENARPNTDECALENSLSAALRGEYLSVLKEPIPPRLNALIQRMRMIESATRD